MPDSSSPQVTTLRLPAIEYRAALATARVQHVLVAEGIFEVTSTETVALSARRRAVVHTLASNERILVAPDRRVARPEGIDGVLYADGTGTPRWASHRRLDQFNQEIAEKGWKSVVRDIATTWEAAFSFVAEKSDTEGELISTGLRPPQIGALHAIGSHWSIYSEVATVVMPTGTGKTETMLAALVAFNPGVLLVVVPTEVLREQTAKKFATLGLLRKLGTLSHEAANPIVGVMHRRPRDASDLEAFAKCHVVVVTMSAIAEGTAKDLGRSISERTGTLIVDEAHHIAAAGWSQFREQFAARPILQFTATPYRRDGKLVDGKVIFDYPLHLAQRDQYFKPITFHPVYALDVEDADEAIATAAVQQLTSDLAKGLDHIIMARCDRISRAREILAIYERLGSSFHPRLVHSEANDSDIALAQLRSRHSRIVIAVNMLGEGFDLPQLKIAALHDTHKSLAVLLQFTGRFTRSAGENIGDATVIANIADQNVSQGLERLYSEDADWNQLLSEFSSQEAKAHSALMTFLNKSDRLDQQGDDAAEVSHHLLRPMQSTIIYHAESFTPKAFFEGIPSTTAVHAVWLHAESHTLYFVTRSEPYLKWSRSRTLRDREWHLHVLHFDPTQQLLFLSSSDKSSPHPDLAKAVGAGIQISGDVIFRSLGHINRLIFQSIGVKKHGRRNLRFAMYTGADVAEALSLSEKAGSVKSNVSGTGWENGSAVAIGCSYKGRIWTREPSSIVELNEWCEAMGRKVLDPTIDTKDIIAHVLIPKEVTALPDRPILSVEWPVEILGQSEDRVVLIRGDREVSLLLVDLLLIRADVPTSTVYIEVRSADGELWADLRFTVGGEQGFDVRDVHGDPASIRIGRFTQSLSQYLRDYPPYIRFVDLTELDGNILLEPERGGIQVFPIERFDVWDWSGVDIRKESIWKDGVARRDSIQWRVSHRYTDDAKYDVVFDDDAPGEAGDLICLRDEGEQIVLTLVHCKFTTGTTAGARVKDVQEVCMQAVRSVKWRGQFLDLCKHVLGREKRLASAARPTRFLKGSVSDITRYAKTLRFKKVRMEVVIAQPGLSRSGHSNEQAQVLGAADSYLKETVDVDLSLIVSE